uniref:Uncharacterized protein n=1 Tax=viral metagenome TaxID=1070528 RepID=A0A6C0C903_9ZZZZ
MSEFIDSICNLSLLMSFLLKIISIFIEKNENYYDRHILKKLLAQP